MMNARKNLFCLALLCLMLTGIIFPPTPLFSEEAQKSRIESDSLSSRRVLSADSLLRQRDADGKKKKEERLEVGGVLMWDYDQFNGVHMGRVPESYQVGNETELRRARIDLKSKIDKDWEAELQVNFEDEDSGPEVGDAFIAFSGWDDMILKVGQTKEPFGLEELTSSSNITFIERSMATAAFAPGHHPGLGLSGDRKSFTWAFGFYEADDRENKRDTYALTGRFTFTPWEYKKRVLHFGISGSERDFGGEIYRIEERAGVHTAGEIIRSIEIQTDDVRLLGVEWAWIMGAFSLQAEHMTAKIKAADGEDATYTGYYIQGSYFLTGEYRPYKNGTFRQVKPDTKYGALELVSRFSYLDVEDNHRGVGAENLALGVNYYPGKRVRLMANYIKTTLKDGVSGEEGRGEAISLRMQYEL
ncbi:MAG: OprO/OprP family phosphate-selective porin [bacterium]